MKSNTSKKRPAYAFWITVFSSAGLFGWAIGGDMAWWAFLVPWLVYGTLIVSLLVFVFAISFLAVILDHLADVREQKRMEKHNSERRIG